MTEEEWLSASSWGVMIRWLAGLQFRAGNEIPPEQDASTGPLSPLGRRPSDRKFRLYACLLARSWDHYKGEVYPEATIARAEEYADGARNKTVLAKAARAFRNTAGSGVLFRHRIALATAITPASSAAWHAASTFSDDIVYYGKPLELGRVPGLAALEIFGNPFRPLGTWAGGYFHWTTGPGTVAVSPPWITEEARWLARHAYNDAVPRLAPGDCARLIDPARLGVLADCLEESGCQVAPVLEHLRSPGPHARGCWALDLILSGSIKA